MRPARARIDRDALAHNLTRVREAAPGRRVVAVIKAGGYGHGAVRVARALCDADAFGVACVEEALELREAGLAHRIVCLEGCCEGGELALASRHRLDVVVHHDAQLELLERAPAGTRVAAWLKIDTGMHRLGFPPGRLREVHARLSACAALAEPVRLMTHLANADDRRDPWTEHQLARFREAAAGVDAETSIANSAGVLGWPDAHGDWVRPGIMLYGISPFVGGRAGADGLRPVMTLETRLIAVNRVPRGEPIGYGGAWVTPEEMPVGIAAIGYGDGYLRGFPSGTPVLVDGRRAALVGRVSMDMIAIDLRAQPASAPGDPVVLWGEGLPLEEVAGHAGTIPYELVCRVASRVRFEETAAAAEDVGSGAEYGMRNAE